MRIGVPKEIKNSEARVSLTPGSVAELVRCGADVIVQTNAGSAIGYSDKDYLAAGAEIARSAGEVFHDADLIVKVKEPQPEEVAMLEPRHTLFTYLHLAADRSLTEGLLTSGATCIAYETVTAPDGSLPLLRPMSEVAGRMATQVGAHYLQKTMGGRGILLGGVAGTPRAKVVILGGGVAGLNALQMAVGMMADVTIFDVNRVRLSELDLTFGGRISTAYSSQDSIDQAVASADLVIGAVLLAGAAAPKLVSRDLVGRMKEGAVVVDIAIDQGGCFETSRATTHQDPVFDVDGVTHYCVANMPGAVARTSTQALNDAILPYVVQIAANGRQVLSDAPGLAAGLNVSDGRVRHPAIAAAFNLPFDPLE